MIQVLDEVKKPSFSRSFGDAFSNVGQAGAQMATQFALEKHQKNLNEKENEVIKGLTGQDVTGLSPRLKELYFSESIKGKSKSSEIAEKLKANKTIIQDIEEKRGLPKGSLNAYIADPKMAEQITRPTKPAAKTQASQPIDPEQLNIIKNVRNQSGFSELDELGQYRAFVDSGVSKENAEAESKLRGQQLSRQQQQFETSYKAQEDFINETTDKYKGFETEMKPRLLQMRNIPDEDLIGPTASVFLDALGIPLGALENPSSELYHKLSQDLLKGLPETYGSRILKVEVDNFLKTIPTLMNSADGRRMIASNMLKLGELKEVYYNQMRKEQKEYLDTGKPLPKDFQQRVFDQVKPQIDRINNEFVKLSEITSVPKGTVPYFGEDDEIYFVDKENEDWARKNGGRRIW